MLCRNPYMAGKGAYPCGQCMPCRFNRRRLWTHRIMLEAGCNVDNCFVTLTYDKDHLPVKDGVPVLKKEDLQLWLKRFRKEISPLKVRFYGVGEYGSSGERPHYHVMLFGFPACFYGQTRMLDSEKSWYKCCASCRIIGETWGKGGVFCGTVTKHSAGYVAAYTVKKMTAADDTRLKGRPPEFCRMSLRPGIGANAMHDVASVVLSDDFGDDRDVPTVLQHGNGKFALGRYLRRRLRELTGREKEAPQEVVAKMAEEMRLLREIWWEEANDLSFKKWLVGLSDGDYEAMMARNAIFKQRKSL